MADEPENLTPALLRDMRRDRTEDRQILLGLVDQIRRVDAKVGEVEVRLGQVETRLDRRIADLRDDLELLLRSELMGRLTSFETTLDDRLERRLDELRAELRDSSC